MKQKEKCDLQLNVKEPAVLRDQATNLVRKLRQQNLFTLQYKTLDYWDKLNTALNAFETLEAVHKAPVDQDDYNMREALAILQLMVMEKNPKSLDGKWSPLLRKIGTDKDLCMAVADFLLS